MAAATLLAAALLLPLGAVAQPSSWGEPPAAATGGSRDAFSSPAETMKPAEMTTPDYCQQLAQESVGVKAPLLLGKKGAMYVGGQDLPGQGASNIWPVSEPETVGFTHAFHHDGRARGEAIVTDTLTGTGHSMWGWEFWRKTKVAYGTVLITDATGSVTEIVTPAPYSLIWQPDQLQATYDLGNGLTLKETKYISTDDVLLDTISLTSSGTADAAPKGVAVRFSGSSYVNPQTISTDDGDPPNTPTSQQRNSTVTFVDSVNQLQILEHGTAYAKTSYCPQTPDEYLADCKAKVGPMMYDGMTVVLSSTGKLLNVTTAVDDEYLLRITFFNLPLLNWVHL